MYVIEDIKNALVNAGIKNKMKYNASTLLIKLNDDNICYITYDSGRYYESEKTVTGFNIIYAIKTKLTANLLEKVTISVDQWDKICVANENYVKIGNFYHECYHGGFDIEKTFYDITDVSKIMPNSINELVNMINFYSE